MASTTPDDPIARLWVHALRAQLDAVVVQFEAQLKQHVAATAGAHEREVAALRQQLAQAQAEGDARQREAVEALAAARRETARARTDGEALRTELARSQSELARARAEAEALAVRRRQEADAARQRQDADAAAIARLEHRLAELGQQVQTLDEQFAAEKGFAAALLAVPGSGLFDAAQQCLGAPLEATPGCYGALKARKLDPLLTAVVRERGRGAQRTPLTEPERAALRALAEAAGCELIEVPPGARFATSTMEKAGTRSEPSEEDLVLECVMPGLRLAGTQGSLVHPRVVVGTA